MTKAQHGFFKVLFLLFLIWEPVDGFLPTCAGRISADRTRIPNDFLEVRFESSTPAVDGDDDDDPTTTASSARIYFDMEVANESIGRLEFEIPNINLLPLHTSNILQLCSQARVGIDPRCSFKGCEFQHSPQFVEGFAQYRWGHTLKGRGRNAVGRADERISDPQNMSRCIHSIYGGQYYGLNYETDVPTMEDLNGKDATVVLTVPLVGPGRGSTELSIVRVGESPNEWKERLLLNTAVLGWLDPMSMDTLLAMARQTQGPPTVIGSGVL